MKSDINIPKFSGAAFLFVAVISAVSESLLVSVTGSGDIPSMLVNISENLIQMRN